ncbi:hypothetical protein EDC54_1075 [Samsonia erythrinae]|uniref:Uncharacterized protein n=1 Tax=Samsonia erythrinae TaxID=160434 RepID=A0A4R3VHI8_9GAMM|nr:hypothetical protein EDC54_1075 [Samsonia erythrinae]
MCLTRYVLLSRQQQEFHCTHSELFELLAPIHDKTYKDQNYFLFALFSIQQKAPATEIFRHCSVHSD